MEREYTVVDKGGLSVEGRLVGDLLRRAERTPQGLLNRVSKKVEWPFGAEANSGIT